MDLGIFSNLSSEQNNNLPNKTLLKNECQRDGVRGLHKLCTWTTVSTVSRNEIKSHVYVKLSDFALHTSCIMRLFLIHTIPSFFLSSSPLLSTFFFFALRCIFHFWFCFRLCCGDNTVNAFCSHGPTKLIQVLTCSILHCRMGYPSGDTGILDADIQS